MRKLTVVLAVAVLLVAACGSDDDTTGSGSGTETTAAASAAPVELEGTVNSKGNAEATGSSFEVELDNFYFNPTFIKGTPGQTLTLELKNEGSAPHTFTSPGLDADEELQPGDTAEVDVTLPDSGATLFFCRFHQSQGMQGAFYFKDGDTLNAAGATSDDGSSGYYSN